MKAVANILYRNSISDFCVFDTLTATSLLRLKTALHADINRHIVNKTLFILMSLILRVTGSLRRPSRLADE